MELEEGDGDELMQEEEEMEEQENHQHEVMVAANIRSIIAGGAVSGLVNDEVQEVLMGLSSKSQEQLLSALRRMRKMMQSDSGEKLLIDYVIASPKCIELCNAWNAGPKAQTSVTMLFLLVDLFRHPVGLRGGDDGSNGSVESHSRKLAVQLRLDKFALWIVQNKLGDVYSHLSSGQRSRENGALRLMSAVVSRGKLLAKQVASKFDFSLDALRKLAKHPVKRKSSGKDELRMTTRVAFIEFAMSFMVVGDAGLLRWILQKRALYAGVLHGLAADSDETVVHVLDVFKEKVLDSDGVVPQGIQVALFGDAALEQLQKITGAERSPGAVSLAQAILLSLCSDPRHGICPSGASWEEFQKVSGQYGGGAGRLLRLMLKLRGAEVAAHKELLLVIAKAKPLLAAAYIDSFPHSLEPRSSVVWFSSVSLLSSLVRIASEPNPFHNFCAHGTPPPSVETPIVQSSLRRFWPQTFSRALFNRALLHEDQRVRISCLKLLLEVLAALERLLRFVDAARESSKLYVEWSKLATYVQDKARIVLPDCHTLLLVHSSLKKQDTDGSVGGKRKLSDEQPGKSKKFKRSDGSEEKISGIWDEELRTMTGEDMDSLLYAKLLDVLTAYQRVLPLALRDVNFDPFKFLPQDMTGLSVLQQKSLVALLLSAVELATSKLTAAAPLYKNFKVLSRLVVSLKSVDVRQQAYALLYGSFYSTGAFEINQHEVAVWLYCLPGWHNGSLETFDETVISFLCDLVSSVGKNLYKYVDQLHSILRKHFIEDAGTTAGQTDPEFGPMVVCALDTYKRLTRSGAKSLKISQKSALSIYLASVLRFLLCSQVSPNGFAVVVTSILSDCDMDSCEWTPLKILNGHAMTCLGRTETMFSSLPKFEHRGTLEQLLHQENNNAEEVERLLYCAHPAELIHNFFKLLESYDTFYNGDYKNLLFLLGAYPEVLSKAALAVPAVSSEAALINGDGEKEDRNAHSIILATIIEKLSFEVLFMATCFNQEGLLALPHFVDVLLTRISGREVVLRARMILQRIRHLHAIQFKDKDRHLDACFLMLKRLMTTHDSDELQQSIVTEIFGHPVICELFLSEETLLHDSELLKAGSLTNFEELKGVLNSSIDLLHPLNRHALRLVEESVSDTRCCVRRHCSRLTERCSELFSKQVERSLVEEQDIVLSAPLIALSVLLPYAEMDSFVPFMQDLSAKVAGKMDSEAPTQSCQLVTLFLAGLVFQKLQDSGCRFEAYLIDISTSVIHLAMLSPSDVANFCLLSVVRFLAEKHVLVAVTPIEVLLHSMWNTNKTKAEVVSCLVQASPLMLAEFGRLVSSRKSEDRNEQLCSLLASDKAYQRRLEGFSLSDDDLMHLLPAALFFLNNFEASEAFHRDTLDQFGSVYGDLLAKRLLDWDTTANFWAEGAGDSFDLTLARVLELSIGVRPLSIKQKRRLLRSLLQMNDAVVEETVHRLLGKASVLKILVFHHRDEDNSRILDFISFLNSTLAALYKQPSLRRAKLLEDQLLIFVTADLEILAADNPGLVFRPVKKLAKTLLRFRFGRPDATMALQRVFVKLLQSLNVEDAAGAQKLAKDVLEFVMAHSQFVQFLLINQQNTSTAMKGTALTDLPSVLSLLGHPGHRKTDHVDVNSFEEEDEKLHIIKFLRVLFAFKLRHKDREESKRTSGELLSLLLATYSATLSRLDQEIFGLMHEIELLEGGEFSGLREMDYLWGDAALKRRKEKSAVASTSGDDTLQESLDEMRRRRFKEDLALDPRKCGMTALHFPTNRGIWSEAELQPDNKDLARIEFQKDIYDPAFLLPFAMHALSVECIDAEEFVRLGLLAVSFSSMSSACEGLRKYGYELLAAFTKRLEESPGFKGKSQIEALLVSIKNAITQPWERISSLISLFAAEASCVLIHPENTNYASLNRFLLHSPSIDLETTPLFQTLFTSGSSNSRSERAWICKLLVGGLVSSADALIYRRQFVAEILMSFCTSSMAESSARQWTLQVLMKAATIHSFAKNLVENTGVLSWLLSAAIKSERHDNPDAALALQVLELFVSGAGSYLLAEGIEELAKVASTLLQFLHTANSKSWKVFGRPSFHIVKTALRLSQKRNKYQSSFNLSWKWLNRIIQKSDEDCGFSAFECILQCPPPPICQKEDEETLCSIIRWAKTMLSRPRPNSREPIPATFMRWCSAAILRGTLATNEKPTFTSWWSYFTYLLSRKEFQCSDSELPRLIIQISTKSEAGTTSTVNALLVLLSGLPKDFPEELHEILKVFLSELPYPVDLNHSWRWPYSGQQLDLNQREVYQALLLLLQQFFISPTRHKESLVSRWKRCSALVPNGRAKQ